MSTAAPDKVISGPATGQEEIRIYFHTPILYWWPIWVAGFVMALWTAIDNHHMILAPAGSEVYANRVIAPEGAALETPMVHVARSRWPGIIFALTVLLVMYLSNASLRGVWGLFGVATLAALVLLFNWLDWWSPVWRWFGLLRVHLNLGAYLFIAVPVLVAWLLTVFFFDRRTYMVFSTGQVRIRDELGEAEKVHDTMTVTFEKAPYDWLRFVVGLGAGDLVMRAGGAQPAYYQLPNVVRVGRKMALIEERLRTRDVV
jgi:hypothetical protein